MKTSLGQWLAFVHSYPSTFGDGEMLGLEMLKGIESRKDTCRQQLQVGHMAMQSSENLHSPNYCWHLSTLSYPHLAWVYGLLANYNTQKGKWYNINIDHYKLSRLWINTLKYPLCRPRHDWQICRTIPYSYTHPFPTAASLCHHSHNLHFYDSFGASINVGILNFI